MVGVRKLLDAKRALCRATLAYEPPFGSSILREPPAEPSDYGTGPDIAFFGVSQHGDPIAKQVCSMIKDLVHDIPTMRVAGQQVGVAMELLLSAKDNLATAAYDLSARKKQLALARKRVEEAADAADEPVDPKVVKVAQDGAELIMRAGGPAPSNKED